jgi:hypothetical protein
MANPSFGQWPPQSGGGTSALSAFGVVEGPSEAHPDGRFLVNTGTAFTGDVVHASTGIFVLLITAGITVSNAGVQTTPRGGSSSGQPCQSAYDIASPGELTLFFRDETGTLVDPSRFTVTLYQAPA